MSNLLQRLRERRAEKRRAKLERAYQENRQGIPARGSGAPRSTADSKSHFIGGGGG